MAHYHVIAKVGNSMYAEIPASEADRHGPIIEAGRSYVINRFKVCNAKSVFRSVPGPNMLQFTCHTKISVATEQITEPKYINMLTPFDRLPEFINDNKKFHGELCVSGYAACHWYINPGIPEVEALLNITHGQSFKIKRAGIPITEQERPDPMPVPDLLTLREMEAIDPFEFPIMNRDNIPPDIAAIGSSKFTFSVTMSEASFLKPKKSYQVNSIIHSYGKQRALPSHGPNQAHLLIQDTKFHTQLTGSVSPSHTLQSNPQAPVLQTPTKMLPLEHISLQTPPKNTEKPEDYPQGSINVPPRKIFKAVTSKIKKMGTSKRQRRDDDPNDDVYQPDPSELTAASSVGGVGDDSDMDVDDGGDEDDIPDLIALNFPG
ncbi:hypothetical protein C2845_PM07G19040 [Panicum miliaceum]|uniref:Uncharacterized protein n=1 Tax=Panicum miliaceum TaxID=4540 RepID=A0A3L6SKE8_PANMI|nr:hypothetical protein C2845_PM07G19040 [Panicum miliaceum]